MTSGDGERPATGPVMPASSDDDAAASAAALCSDSDDLLTTRRGGMPPQLVRPTNGHVAADAPVEQSFSGVAMATAIEDDVPVADTPDVATPELAVPAEPGSPELADPAPAAAPVVAGAPPPEPIVPPATAAEPAPLVHETSVATLVGAPEEPRHAVHDAPVAGAEKSPLIGDEAAADHAFIADETPPNQDLVAPPPMVVDPWIVEPAAPSNGVAVHVAATAEYPAVDHATPAEVQEVAVPALTVPALPTDEINDIEVPLPAVVAGEHTMASDSTVMEVPVADASTELVEAPAMEPGDGLATPDSIDPIILADPDIPAEPPVEPPAPPLAAAPPPPPAAPPPEEGEEEGATMTIIEHLEELRHRITIGAISIVVGAVAGWFITPHVVQYLEDAARKLGGKFFSPTILGPFGLELKLSFLIGFVIASPMVLYQIWGFVAPGLTRRERRYALPFSLIGGALFAGGALTGVLVVPLAIQFLTHFFQVLDLEQLLDIDKYIMFITLIAVIFGITFELPIFMVGFSLLGVVNSRFFIQKFKIAIFVIYGAAMVITPGADLVSPLVLGTFLIVLYWLGVLLIRVIGR